MAGMTTEAPEMAVEGCEASGLPGCVSPTLQAVYDALSPTGRQAFKAHLLGGTSADWLAAAMRDGGHRLSATSIRVYRRSLQ